MSLTHGVMVTPSWCNGHSTYINSCGVRGVIGPRFKFSKKKTYLYFNRLEIFLFAVEIGHKLLLKRNELVLNYKNA